jgi:hypothetical protein
VVRLIAETSEHTRVTFEQRNIDRHAEGRGSVRDGVDSEGGWPPYRRRFAELLEAGVGAAQALPDRPPKQKLEGP